MDLYEKSSNDSLRIKFGPTMGVTSLNNAIHEK